MTLRKCLLAVVLVGLVGESVRADDPAYTRVRDIIYGRSFGTALTMDVFTPTRGANGIGVISLVSGGWFSAKESIDSPHFLAFADALTRRGYTVFAVVHGSTPKYAIPEILPQISRAVRYVRFRAGTYNVDPDRLGVTGGSAGGHLSLMQGCAPVPEDPKSPDPVDRVSARVQAVGCFFPPTDFLNYGKPDHRAIGANELSWLQGPFDFREMDTKTNLLRPITDPKRVDEIGRQISPLNHVTPDDAPALVIHGDADKLVPVQQGQAIVDALTKAGVAAKLVIKPGAGHGWAGIEKDIAMIADWFDEHLLRRPVTGSTP